AATITAVLLKNDGAIQDQFKAERFTGDDPPVRIANFVKEASQRFATTGPVGIAVPGLIDRAAGNVEFSATIPEHSSLNIREVVRSITGLDALIENDANAAAYAEFMLGA